MTLDDLKAEIRLDPTGQGYNYGTGRPRGTDTILALLNAERPFRCPFIGAGDVLDAVDFDDFPAGAHSARTTRVLPDGGVHFGDHYWLALVVCTGQIRTPGRAWEILLDMFPADSGTYGRLLALQTAGTIIEQSRSGFLWGEEADRDMVREARAALIEEAAW